MTTPDSPRAEDFDSDRPIVFRGGTVITVDSAGVLEDADVLMSATRSRPSARGSRSRRARSKSTRAAGS
jgi:hypothetical protein